MASLMEFEGTWEQILERASELEGCRVRVTVLTDSDASIPGTAAGPDRKDRVIAAWERYEQTPLTAEETAILDEFEAFRKEHPLRLRIPTFLDDPE